MLTELLRTLRTRQPEIRTRWEMLLRGERVNTALAHPDTLVFMIDSTVEELLHTIERGRPLRHRAHRPTCPCGRNPLLAYFQAGEQALLEEMILAQVAMSGLHPHDREVAVNQLRDTVRDFADTEIEAFCGLCRYRDHPAPAAAHSHSHAAHAHAGGGA